MRDPRALVSCLLLGLLGMGITAGAEDSELSGVQGPAREKRSEELYVTFDCPPSAIYLPSPSPSGPQPPAAPLACPPGTYPVVSPGYMAGPQRACLAWVDEDGACRVRNEIYPEDECRSFFGSALYREWESNTLPDRRRKRSAEELQIRKDSASQLEDLLLSREKRRSPTGDFPDIYAPGSYPPGSPGSLPGYDRQHTHPPGAQPRYRRRSPTGDFPDIYAPGSYPPGSPGSLPGYNRQHTHPPGAQPRYRRRSPTGDFPDIYAPGSYPPGSPGSLPGYNRQHTHPPGAQPRYRRRSPVAPRPIDMQENMHWDVSGVGMPSPSYICVPDDE